MDPVLPAIGAVLVGWGALAAWFGPSWQAPPTRTAEPIATSVLRLHAIIAAVLLLPMLAASIVHLPGPGQVPLNNWVQLVVLLPLIFGPGRTMLLAGARSFRERRFDLEAWALLSAVSASFAAVTMTVAPGVSVLAGLPPAAFAPYDAAAAVIALRVAGRLSGRDETDSATARLGLTIAALAVLAAAYGALSHPGTARGALMAALVAGTTFPLGFFFARTRAAAYAAFVPSLALAVRSVTVPQDGLPQWIAGGASLVLAPLVDFVLLRIAARRRTATRSTLEV